MSQTIILVGDSQRQFAKKLISDVPNGYVVKISSPTRSNSANALMWALLSDVSRSKPMGRRHTPEVWKNLMLHACGHAVQFETGLDGQPFPVGFRTSKLKTEQMSELLDFIQSWGSQNGVEWTHKEE